MYATIHKIKPFDADTGTTITFTWNGNQIHKVRCIIKDNQTGEQIYNVETNTMKSEFVVPESEYSKLENGGYYIAFITVFDSNDNESALQPIGTPFYCFEIPKFQLNISEHDTIETSSYQVELTYEQPQREQLNEYTISLYSYQKTLIQQYGPFHPEEFPEGQFSLTFKHILTALENATDYYVEATGITTQHMDLSTGMIHITVAYLQAQIFSTLELNNRPELGAIEIRSNIVSTEGVPEDEVSYLDNYRYADLRNNSVTFDIGYQTIGDFSKVIMIDKPNLNCPVLTFTDQEKLFKAQIYYREGSYADSSGYQAYFELNADDKLLSYTRFSNFTDIPEEDQMFALCITRRDSYYELTSLLIPK